MADALSELERLSLVNKVCSEIHNNLGINDTTLGMLCHVLNRQTDI